MGLAVVWFVLVALLWTGFFVLEGFDFGVGMLHAAVGRSDEERQLAVDSIGPLWDGNEVWLIVAAAGMFAAFPGWYATMFSGFYLPLILLLAALIVRGVSFEYRDKRESERWRRTWSLLMTLGSLVAPLVIGIALGDLLHGVPINSQQEFTGGVGDLVSPYSLFVGVTVVATVPHPRSDVPRAQGGRRRRRPGPDGRSADRPVRGPRRARLRLLDRGHHRPGRRPRPRPRDRRARGRGHRPARPARPGRLGVHLDDPGDGGDHLDDLPQPVSARHGLQQRVAAST